MKKWKKALLLSTLALSISVFGVGCGSKNSGTEQTGDKKEYIVATDAAFAPFEWMEPNGDIVGFDIDLINAIAEEAGISVKVQHTGWDPMLETVKNGQSDLAIAAITNTTDRQIDYDFSDSYLEASQYILVKKDSTVTSLKDLEGKNISVQQGTTGDIAVRDAFGQDYAGVKAFEAAPMAIQELLVGRVDATVLDKPVILEYLKSNPSDELKYISDDTFEKEYYGIIVKKGNTELLEKINTGLKKIQENGKYDEIFNKYFAEINN